MKDDFVNEVEVNLMANKVAVITGGGHGIGKAIIINCYDNDTRFGLIDAMYYKMLGTVRSKEIPFHFLHVQNTNQVIENRYSVVKAEVE